MSQENFMPSAAVDTYFMDGCGRCSLTATPQCKIHRWKNILWELREMLLLAGLQEERKWGVPCYMHKGKNMILLGAFKDYCVISFLQGALLTSHAQLLEKPGEESQIARFVRLYNIEQFDANKQAISDLIEEAKGKVLQKVATKKIEEYSIPEELNELLLSDQELQAAFNRLTPGRKRSFYIHVAGAKQAETRRQRAQKCIPLIMEGLGWNEIMRNKYLNKK